MKQVLFTSVFILLSASLLSQKIAGNWYGNIAAGGQTIPIVFHFNKDTSGQIKGTWDSPKQKAFGFSFTNISVTEDSLLLLIKMIGGSYNGKFIGNDSIAGMWHQGGGNIALNFSRSAGNTVIAEVKLLPNEKEIAVISSGIRIYGTLLSRNNKQKLAIIIAGSGPTDRDGNNPMGAEANSYKLLAQSLDSQNIASFRYDKRGIAKSMTPDLKENQLVFEDYIKDAQTVFNYLYDTLGFKDIYIIGHSEGSLIGMVVAQEKNKVRGYISLAGSGRPIDKIIEEQLQRQLPDSLQKTAALIFSELKQGRKVTDIPPQLLVIFRKSIQPYMISWLKYSPGEEIKKVRCPVLIQQGTCDKQVSVKDAEILHNANKKSRLDIIPLMTHTLKNADEKCVDENNRTYTDSSLPLNKVLVDHIVAFIKKK